MLCAGEVDFVTLPFVQMPEDVLQARKFLDEHGGPRIKVRNRAWPQSWCCCVVGGLLQAHRACSAGSCPCSHKAAGDRQRQEVFNEEHG